MDWDNIDNAPNFSTCLVDKIVECKLLELDNDLVVKAKSFQNESIALHQ